MSRSTPYIIVAVLLLGAALIWWLPPVRIPPPGNGMARLPTARATATASTTVATATPTVPEAQGTAERKD